MESSRAERPLRVGVLLYTYNRIDDARISQEIIRNVWKRIPLLEDVVIVHAFNGDESWWSAPYLEDTLCRTENPGHFAGAALLLDKGMEVFATSYPYVTHVLLLASDTWCVKPEYVERIVREMDRDKKYLATSAWGSKQDTDMFRIGMSLDFSVVDTAFVGRSQFFPLRYQEFTDKYGEVLNYGNQLVFLERVFALRFKQAVARILPIPSENLIGPVTRAHLYHLIEREPIHYTEKKLFGRGKGRRVMFWPKLGLITHHEPRDKQQALKSFALALGRYGSNFLNAKDLSYYNQGLRRTNFENNGIALDYND